MEQSAAELAVISWNQVLLYPKGWKSDDITYSGTVSACANLTLNGHTS